MLGIAWYLATVVASFVVLVARLSPRLTLVELVAASVVVGSIVPAWIVYLIACLTSAIGPHGLFGATAVILYLAYEHLPTFLKRIGPAIRSAVVDADGRKDTLLACVVTGVAALFLVPLYSTRFIPEHDGKVWSGGSCWADLPIHMHMAQSFLVGRNQDISWGGMHSPVFAGEPMAYPFLPDFHAAVLVKIGATMRMAMMLPGLLLALSLVTFFYTFTVRVTRSRLGGVLAILIAIGAGGMGGWSLSRRGGFWNAISQDTAQNDVSGDGKIMWFAFIPHVLLPQRGANFAYPMVMLVLTLVWRAGDMRVCERIGNAERRAMLIMAGAFSGSLPLIQAHSFIALGVMIGVFFALDFHKWTADPRILVSWVTAGVVAIAVGYPQMGLFKHQVESGHGGHFLNFGWWFKNHDFGRAGGVSGFFNFWWMSLGPAVPLFIFAVALQAWELFCAHRLATQIKTTAGPGKWREFYSLAVYCEPSTPKQPLPPPRYILSPPTAASGAAPSATASGEASGSGVVGAGAGDAVPSSYASPAPKAARRVTSQPSSGAPTPAAGRGLSSRRVASSTSIHSASSSGLESPGAAFDAASAMAPIAPPSQPVEVRISSLGLEYTLPSSGGDGPGQRFKLELPSSTASVTHTGLLSTLAAAVTPRTASAATSRTGSRAGSQGPVVAGAAGGVSARSRGAGAAPAPSPIDNEDVDEEGGAVESDEDLTDITGIARSAAPPIGARVATAYQASSKGMDASSASNYVLSSYRDPASGAYFSEHLWSVAKASARSDLGIDLDVALAPETYRFEAIDRLVFHLNACSLSGRCLDTLKLAVGAAAVFLVGNYINFQPWDRDNCKLFYVSVFVNASLVGGLLAAPLEYLWDSFMTKAHAAYQPGFARLASVASLVVPRTYADALFLQSQAEAASSSAAGGKDKAASAACGAGSAAAAVPANRLASAGSSLPKHLYPEGCDKADAANLKRTAGGISGKVALAGSLALVPSLLLLCLTGFMMVFREYGLYHVLLDEDQAAVGDWIIANTPPKGVWLHRDVHISPAGCLAGRPTLVAYNGWMWSHGYNYYERDRDRQYVHENSLKDSDTQAYNLLRRWGVRYVLGEWMPKHHRPSQQAYDDAKAQGAAQLPAFDPDSFLDGNLKRVFSSGRFDVMEVQGYGFPPT